MLIGTYESKLVSGRRVAIPSTLRRRLGEKVILAKWYEKCVVLVGEGQWEKLIGKLTGKVETITRPVRDTDRFILGSAYEAIPDKQGRVVVPEVLMKHAEIKGEIVFLGLGERVEIWDKAKWLEHELFIEEKAGDMVETLALARLRPRDA